MKKAHSVMMEALTDDVGRYRNGGVVVFGEKDLEQILRCNCRIHCRGTIVTIHCLYADGNP